MGDQSYMGGPAMKGTELKLTINDVPFESFQGYSPLQETYKLKIKSAETWNQYVIFIDQGSITYDEKMGECEGKRVLIGDIENEFELIWNPSNTKNDIAALTIGYAPFYTLISIQSFNILPATIENVVNSKQEM